MTEAEFPKTHNLPPDLASQLEIETTELQQRADELFAAAGKVAVTDRESAEKATLLLGMIMSHGKKIEAARELRKKPILEDGRTVDGHYARIRSPLIGLGDKLGGVALTIKTAAEVWQAEQERLAAAERRRLEEEARLAREAQARAEQAQREAEEAAQREAAEAARKIAAAEEAARRAGDAEAAAKAAQARAEADAQHQREESERRIANEITARQSAERAADLERQAASTRVTSIDTGYGVKASTRTRYVVTITDLTTAIKHARKLNESAIREAVQKILDAQSRAGVRTIPGCTVSPESSIQIRGAA